METQLNRCIASMILGALAATAQTKVKRLLAHISIGHLLLFNYPLSILIYTHCLALPRKINMINNDHNKSLIREDHKLGVKHLCEMGVTKVPIEYILPAVERPIRPISSKKSYEITKGNLPIIDFAQLHGPNHAQVIASLAHACENYGFFQLINHGISSAVISEMEDVSRRFFELPLEERKKYMSTDIQSLVRYGTSYNQNNDSVFSWRDFLKLVCNEDALSHWPSSPSDFRKTGVRYASDTKILFQLLMEAILESLGLGLDNNNKAPKVNQDSDKDYNDITTSLEDGSQMLVINCYPTCPEPELTFGMPPHSDYGFLTLLLQDEVEGLQILFKDRWVTIQPHPNSFVVNVGDHLEIFSNGMYKSVMHRVLVNSTKPRLSVASLHSLSFSTVVRPSPRLINDKNPRRYKDTDFASFVQYIKSCDSKHKNFLESRKLTTIVPRQSFKGT
ncbi:probable 2-oxoglutarate-dependent dioxygenase SLC1 [Rutidosis leptorrhynchoides]|uniref:probable 2-oxoglutarate-dependent dioxygenase SLC1 n=1 Tax=Rutidosis leptorrhynchoides TaxID=125765 RepID=UPI003A9A34E8